MNTQAVRERQQYNHGLQRKYFCRLLQHSQAYSERDLEKKLQQSLSYGNRKVVLELGSSCWYTWLESMGIYPSCLHCTNISEVELAKGIDYHRHTVNSPVFHHIDANQLAFQAETFDLVFGGGILHHLHLPEALSEIQRVLKPDGRIVFVEPLGINPIAKLVRFLTPKTRTVDEQPFRFKELVLLQRSFNVSLDMYELFSSLCCVPSAFFFKNPQNPLMYFSTRLDVVCLKLFPLVRYMYYKMLITGEKPQPKSLKGEGAL